MCQILSCIIEGIVGYGKMKQGARQCIEERKGTEKPLLAREKTSLRSDERFWFSNSVEVKKRCKTITLRLFRRYKFCVTGANDVFLL